MPSFEYRCEGCGFEDFELRKPEQREDPLECAECKGAMKSFIGPQSASYIRIQDTKYWQGETPGSIVKKTRTRVISEGKQTEIGRVKIGDLHIDKLRASKE